MLIPNTVAAALRLDKKTAAHGWVSIYLAAKAGSLLVHTPPSPPKVPRKALTDIPTMPLPRRPLRDAYLPCLNHSPTREGPEQRNEVDEGQHPRSHEEQDVCSHDGSELGQELHAKQTFNVSSRHSLQALGKIASQQLALPHPKRCKSWHGIASLQCSSRVWCCLSKPATHNTPVPFLHWHSASLRL